MTITWSPKLKARLLPFPGEEWSVATSVAKAEKAIAKVSKPVPSGSLKVDDEVKRGVKLRLNCRYDAKGANARDTHGRDLVDIWCAREGVTFATEVLIAICKTDHQGTAVKRLVPYMIRQDGQPWARLREHLACAPEVDRKRATEIAEKARPSAKGELGAALAYAFCVDKWVKAELERTLKDGYGRLAVLTALRERAAIEKAVDRLFSAPRYQLVEELYLHFPNLMLRLGEAAAISS